jgi:hypothetical protein
MNKVCLSKVGRIVGVQEGFKRKDDYFLERFIKELISNKSIE